MDGLSAGMHTQIYEDNSGYVSGGNAGGFPVMGGGYYASGGNASDGDASVEAPDESLFGDPEEIDAAASDPVVPEDEPAADDALPEDAPGADAAAGAERGVA